MSEYFSDDEMEYEKKFQQLWNYVQIYMIDHEHGGWYNGGIDKEPHQKKEFKGHIWKSTYHNFRALDNCIKRLRAG